MEGEVMQKINPYALKRFSFVFWIFGILILMSPLDAMAVVFNDGGVHYVHDYIGAVEVYDAPGGIPTTVNFISGGSTSDLLVSGNSVVSLSNGSYVTYVQSLNNSSVNVYGGGHENAEAEDNSSWTITGGGFDSLSFRDNSRLTVDGGGVSNLSISSGATATVVDIIGCLALFNSGTSRIYSGQIDTLVAGGVTDIYGVRGYGPFEFYVSGDVSFYGTGFNVPFGTYTQASGLSDLIGILSDGSSLDIALPSSWGAGATITLIDSRGWTVPSSVIGNQYKRTAGIMNLSFLFIIPAGIVLALKKFRKKP